MTRRTQTLYLHGRQIRVEHRPIVRVAPSRTCRPDAPPPDHIGALAIDAGHLLRRQPLRFPTDFFPTAYTGDVA